MTDADVRMAITECVEVPVTGQVQTHEQVWLLVHQHVRWHVAGQVDEEVWSPVYDQLYEQMRNANEQAD